MYNMKNIETGSSKMLQSQRNTCSLKTKNAIENYFNELLLIHVCVCNLLCLNLLFATSVTSFKIY